jgi:hypothetical protein
MRGYVHLGSNKFEFVISWYSENYFFVATVNDGIIV